jgi:hypothetical protein
LARRANQCLRSAGPTKKSRTQDWLSHRLLSVTLAASSASRIVIGPDLPVLFVWRLSASLLALSLGCSERFVPRR